jgi:hypothetical protein
MFGDKKHKHEWETVPCIVTEIVGDLKVSRIVEHCKDCGAYQSIEVPTDRMRKRFERDEVK